MGGLAGVFLIVNLTIHKNSIVLIKFDTTQWKDDP